MTDGIATKDVEAGGVAIEGVEVEVDAVEGDPIEGDTSKGAVAEDVAVQDVVGEGTAFSLLEGAAMGLRRRVTGVIGKPIQVASITVTGGGHIVSPTQGPSANRTED